MIIPHTTTPDWSQWHPRPSRLACAIKTNSPDNCKIAILGIPDDTGIAINEGRKGASEGPRAFRKALSEYGCAHDAISGKNLANVGIFDAGDIQAASEEIHITHERVTDAVGAILDMGMLPVCIGGGHDLTYAATRALLYRTNDQKKLGGFNIDAHLEVRERIGSGMTFRHLFTDGKDKIDTTAFIETGIGPFTNAPRHIDWLAERNSTIIYNTGNQQEVLDKFTDQATRLNNQNKLDLFASVDLDVLDSSYAQGVGELNPMGLKPTIVSRMCRTLGAMNNLKYFDIMELSPPHDTENKTARIAAHLFLNFLAGYAERL